MWINFTKFREREIKNCVYEKGFRKIVSSEKIITMFVLKYFTEASKCIIKLSISPRGIFFVDFIIRRNF